MDNLLDFIFKNLDIDSLNRLQVQKHLNYLVEINSQLPNADERIKFQNIKLLLEKRLVELDKQLIKSYSNNGLLLLYKKKQQHSSE